MEFNWNCHNPTTDVTGRKTFVFSSFFSVPLVFNKQVIRLLEDLKNDYSSFETYQKLALANWTLTANNPSLIDIGLNKRIAYLSG